jgi:hypothetical protein
MLRTDHQRLLHPSRERLARALGDLEPDRPLRLALDDRSAFLDMAGGVDVSNLQAHEVTTSQFTVDGEVEQRQVSVVLSDLKANTNGPDGLRHQRSLLANDTAFVPSGTASSNGR